MAAQSNKPEKTAPVKKVVAEFKGNIVVRREIHASDFERLGVSGGRDLVWPAHVPQVLRRLDVSDLSEEAIAVLQADPEIEVTITEEGKSDADSGPSADA